MKVTTPKGPVLLMNQANVALKALMSLHEDCETAGSTGLWFAVNKAVKELQQLRHSTYHWQELSDFSNVIATGHFRSRYQLSLDRAYTLGLLGANTYPSAPVTGQVSFWVDSSPLSDLVVGERPATVIGVCDSEIIPLRIPPSATNAALSSENSFWRWEDFSMIPDVVGQQACPVCSDMFHDVYFDEAENQGYVPSREHAFKNRRAVVGHSVSRCPFLEMTSHYATLMGQCEAGKGMKALRLGIETDNRFPELVWRHKFHLNLMRAAAKSHIALERQGA